MMMTTIVTVRMRLKVVENEKKLNVSVTESKHDKAALASAVVHCCFNNVLLHSQCLHTFIFSPILIEQSCSLCNSLVRSAATIVHGCWNRKKQY